MYNYNMLGTWFNRYSKAEDMELYDVMEAVTIYAQKYLRLPSGYIYERWDTVPYIRMREWLTGNGWTEYDTTYLTVPNPAGGYASIKPDGGLIVAVRKDNGGNIIDWIPMLASEAKHQESSQGNAIERMFKNYSALANLFACEEIFPYICFAQGKGFGSSFIQNKIRVAVGGDVNNDVNIRNIKTHLLNGKVIERQVGNVFVREKRWTAEEMFGRLVTAIQQSHDYFFEYEETPQSKDCVVEAAISKR